jgi:hypothetical protein
MLNLFNAISKKFWNRCQKPSAALFHGLTYALSRATTLLPMADLIIPYKSPLIRFQLLQDLQANEIKQWNSEKTLVSFLTDTFRKHDFSFYAGDAIFSDRISNVIESLSFWHFFRECIIDLEEEAIEPILYAFLSEFDYFYHPLVYYYSLKNKTKSTFAISFLPSGSGLPPDFISERLGQLSITKSQEISNRLSLNQRVAQEWLKEYKSSLVTLKELRSQIIREASPHQVGTRKYKRSIIRKIRRALTRRTLSHALVFPTGNVEKCSA